MVMSIFSPFDALSAEIFGQKLNIFKAYNSTHEPKQQQVVAPLVTNHQAVDSPLSTCTSSSDLIKKAREASPLSSARQQPQKRQRFALEFDELPKQVDDGKGLAGTVADVNDANKRGPLIFTAREGKTDLCNYLVEELKSDVNEKDSKIRPKRTLGEEVMAILCAS
ncbi:hypothetical protein BC332_30883 [Capsicum chinense]|nr:hypothetical protein BC332_30883 [Capsicum chinense]